MSEERYWIFGNGETLGPFALRKLYDMRMEGRLPGKVLFFSNRRQDWFPLSGIIEDEFPSSDRITDLKRAGITHCEVLLSGNNDECDACKAISGRKIPVLDFTGLPPAGCECVPWCRCAVVAVDA